MKSLKILVCALFVLCGGLFLSACGEKQNFDVSKITISALDEFTYDGKSHVVSVEYEGVDVDITYALESDKNNFKPLSSLNTVDVGEYEVYYRLSAKGYNSYTSSGTLSFEVVPKRLEINLIDYSLMMSSKSSFSVSNIGFTSNGIIPNDNIGLNIEIGNEFDINNISFDETYPITCSVDSLNYNLILNPATLYVKDYVQLNDAEGNFVSYYSNIQEAIDNAQSGQTVVLNDTIMLDKTIEVNKSITIDGQGKYEIIAKSYIQKGTYAGKEVASLFNVADQNVELRLKDVTLSGSNVVRGVSAFAGKVVVDNSVITKGKKTDKWRSGGVYVTSKASFEMKSGAIVGNNANDNEYTKYCADLWVGANAQGSLCSINGGVVGSVFVNSNSYSALGAGKFVLDGGSVENIYVEYDSGYGANFEYVKGEIENLLISLANDKANYYGISHKVQPVENTTYVGGKLVYTETATEITGNTYYDNIDEYLTDGNNYIFENCTFNSAISTNKKVGLIFNNCSFQTSNSIGGTNLYLTSVTDLVVNNCVFGGALDNGHAIDLNIYSTNCENIVIANNVFNRVCLDDISISIKTRLGSTDHPTYDWAQNATAGTISGKVQVVGNDFADYNNMICVGAGPEGMDTSANLSTGDFDIIVNKNIDVVSVYNKFKDHKYIEGDYRSILVLQAGGIYDSTNE